MPYSPRGEDGEHGAMGMAQPSEKELEASFAARAAEILATVEEQQKRLQAALERESAAAAKLEALEPKLTGAKSAVAFAQQAVDSTSGAMSAALSDKERHETQVADAERELAKMRDRLAAMSEGVALADAASGLDSEEEAEAIKRLDRKQLDEVRQLLKPPNVVRRAMELVQVLLLASETDVQGAVALPPEGVEWAELVQMITKSDFISRILQLQPLALSLRPAMLEAMLRRWPGLKDASLPSNPKSGWAKARSFRQSRELTASRRMSRQLTVGRQASDNNVIAGAAAAALGASRRKSRELMLLRQASDNNAIAGAAEALTTPPVDEPLTAELVEYASKPVGAIFRWCGGVLRAALRLVREREELKALIEAQGKRVEGLTGELRAVLTFQTGLHGDHERLQLDLNSTLTALQRLEAERDAVARQLVEARFQIQDARARIAAAEAQALADEDAARRKLLAEEEARKRLRFKEESLRLAQARIAEDLATRPPVPERATLAWLHMPTFEEVKPFEFIHSSTTLAIDAHVTLGKIMKLLQESPGLRLHIAGHVQGDEDPRISSQRAQAVGAALIAVGAAPARLRAKGYGATVPIPAQLRAKLRVKSERRVSIHAIGEVATKVAIQFDKEGCEVSEEATRVLEDVAVLLAENSKMRLSVEGHADEMGQPSENARLSALRAQQVCTVLQHIGVNPNRLVAHGFGATLPIDDNSTPEGRAKNRRVQFLVIPDVAPTAKP